MKPILGAEPAHFAVPQAIKAGSKPVTIALFLTCLVMLSLLLAGCAAPSASSPDSAPRIGGYIDTGVQKQF